MWLLKKTLLALPSRACSTCPDVPQQTTIKRPHHFLPQSTLSLGRRLVVIRVMGRPCLARLVNFHNTHQQTHFVCLLPSSKLVLTVFFYSLATSIFHHHLLFHHHHLQQQLHHHAHPQCHADEMLSFMLDIQRLHVEASTLLHCPLSLKRQRLPHLPRRSS